VRSSPQMRKKTAPQVCPPLSVDSTLSLTQAKPNQTEVKRTKVKNSVFPPLYPNVTGSLSLSSLSASTNVLSGPAETSYDPLSRAKSRYHHNNFFVLSLEPWSLYGVWRLKLGVSSLPSPELTLGIYSHTVHRRHFGSGRRLEGGGLI
jgi:hypothetical protein